MTAPAWKPGQQLLSAQEAADYLTIKRGTLYDLVQAGRIEHLRITNRELRFTKQQLDQWLSDKLVTATARPGHRINPSRRASVSAVDVHRMEGTYR